MNSSGQASPPRKTHDDGGIMLMLLIFILAGAFSAIAGKIGCVDSVVNLTLSVLPSNSILIGLFVAACIVSLSIGTSCGTIAALTPIAAGIASSTGSSTPMFTAAIVGGSLFGDNLSFISDTTIMATKTQGCLMSDKFRANIGIALPAAIATILLYTFLGKGVESQTTALSDFSAIHTLPYLLVFVLALTGLNVIWVLTLGILSASLIGILWENVPITDIWLSSQDGVMGMHDLIVITIIAAVFMNYLRRRGAIEWIIGQMGKLVSTRRGAEFSIAGAVVATDMLTANNTIAILAVGPVARSISYSYGIEPRRAASILDTMSCFAQGIIPWGAQLLIAAGLASISPLDIMPHLYYPYILGLITMTYIIAHRNQKH